MFVGPARAWQVQRAEVQAAARLSAVKATGSSAASWCLDARSTALRRREEQGIPRLFWRARPDAKARAQCFDSANSQSATACKPVQSKVRSRASSSCRQQQGASSPVGMRRKACALRSRALTLPSRGRPTSGFAGCRPPLMSNVRPPEPALLTPLRSVYTLRQWSSRGRKRSAPPI